MFNFHLLKISIWPVLVSLNLLNMLIGVIILFYNGTNYILIISFILLLYFTYNWFYDIYNESLVEHSSYSKYNLLFGYYLFILSEVIIFVSLFISFFYSSLIVSIELANDWPPYGLSILNYLSIPLLNTIILYLSGLTITISINYLYLRNNKLSLFYLYITLILAIIFSYLQYNEYISSSFTILDSNYATNFYILTGWHGIHVLIGTSLLIFSLIQLLNYNYYFKNYLTFIMSSIYWHFVDYVWLFLYTFIYFWSS